jgi:superfamily II DNA or RNA helicase
MKTPKLLRDYQIDAKNVALTSFVKNSRSVVWLPTGSGKTVVASAIIADYIGNSGKRVIFLAHTQEIIYQSAEKIADQTPNVSDFVGKYPGVGIVMASRKDYGSQIIVATRQTLMSRGTLDKILSYGRIDLLVIDECHHVSPDNSYMNVYDALKAVKPELDCIGFSATPKRSDRKALASIFTDICYSMSLKEAMNRGILVPAIRKQYKTGIDLANVGSKFDSKINDYDYNKSQLVSILNSQNWVELCIKAYQKEIADSDRQTLAYFSSVAESRLFADSLNALYGVGYAVHIDGKTKKGKVDSARNKAIADFTSGKLKVITNMNVFTEGTDLPPASCILLARPTRSQTLFTQIIGRGLRLFPGKKDCLILDMTVEDTKVLTLVNNLLGKLESCPECGVEFYKGYKKCPSCGNELFPDKETEKTETKPGSIRVRKLGSGNELYASIIELFDDNSGAWHTTPDDNGMMTLSIGFNNDVLVIMPPTRQDPDPIRERISKGIEYLQSDSCNKLVASKLIGQLEQELKATNNYMLYRVNTKYGAVRFLDSNDDLPSLMIASDSHAQKICGKEYKTVVDKNAKWRQNLPSEAQIKFYRSLGGTEDITSMNRGDLAKALTHIQATKAITNHIEKQKTPDKMAD